MRKFSIPFTWESGGANYLEAITPFMESIDSVYMGVPYFTGLPTHLHGSSRSNPIPQEETRRRDRARLAFLSESYGKVKRIVVYNASVPTMSLPEHLEVVKAKLIPFLRDYKIEALVTTHFYVAKCVKYFLPDIEIQTSCNNFQFTIPHMRTWKEELGVELFNPPREVLRMPKVLREMKEAGFKLKGIVNEACLFGCPNTITHAGTHAYGLQIFSDRSANCRINKLENIFKTNLIIPRWLPQLDPYVDVYKIVGRGNPLPYILNIFEAYRTLDDEVSIFNLAWQAGCHQGEFYDFQAKNLPDALLTCEGAGCAACGICAGLATQLPCVGNK